MEIDFRISGSLRGFCLTAESTGIREETSAESSGTKSPLKRTVRAVITQNAATRAAEKILFLSGFMIYSPVFGLFGFWFPVGFAEELSPAVPVCDASYDGAGSSAAVAGVSSAFAIMASLLPLSGRESS